MQINQPQNQVRYHAIFVLANGVSGELDIIANTNSTAYLTACKMIEPLKPLDFAVYKEQQLKVYEEMPRLVKLPNLEYQVAWIDPTATLYFAVNFRTKRLLRRFTMTRRKERVCYEERISRQLA